MHEFDLKNDPQEMDPDDARATLADFMEKHTENIEEHRELKEDHEELKSDFSDAEAALEELKTKFAEEAAEYVKLSPDVIADRFTYSEIAQIVEEGEEADFDENDETDESDDKSFTTFADRDEKGNMEGTEYGYDRDQKRDRAEQKLKNAGFLKE